MVMNQGLPGVVGQFNGRLVYGARRKDIESGNWSAAHYYVIKDDGQMLFHNGKVHGYLVNGDPAKLRMFDAPRDYPRGKAEEEMMKKVIVEEDALLRDACNTDWTKKYLSEV